jgi:hypothetical protein
MDMAVTATVARDDASISATIDTPPPAQVP